MGNVFATPANRKFVALLLASVADDDNAKSLEHIPAVPIIKKNMRNRHPVNITCNGTCSSNSKQDKGTTMHPKSIA